MMRGLTIVRENSWLVGAITAKRRSGKFAVGRRRTTRALHGKSTTIEAIAHHYFVRVDPVPLHQIQSVFNFSNIRVAFKKRTGPDVVLVPHSVDIICHHVEPVDILLKPFDIEVLKVPIACR
jgi:hypothetical protein